MNVYTLLASPGPATEPPDLPAERFCPSCGALLVSEEESRWGCCSYCLNVPLGIEVTQKGRAHAERH